MNKFTDDQSAKLKDFATFYFQLINNELSGINLTGFKENFDIFYQNQIQDSVQPLLESSIFRNRLEKSKYIIDLGFGGGFPILPLSILYPDLSFYGVDSKKKKCDVVADISTRFGLMNNTFVHSRFSDLDFDINNLLFVLKAVGDVEKILPMLVVPRGTMVYFYKGPNFKEKEQITTKTLKNWKIIENISFKINSSLSRILIGFECVKVQNVPRGTNKAKLLKFSEIIKDE
jgi:16S rRNA (guanine527-N7)-methyltransferase